MNPNLTSEIAVLASAWKGCPPSAAGARRTFLKLFVESVSRLAAADRTAVILLDPLRRTVIDFQRGGEGWERVVTTVPYEELDDGLTGWVVRNQAVAVSPKEAPDPRESAAVQARRASTNCGAVVVLPLTVTGKFVGTVTAIRTLQQPNFTDEEVAELVVLCQFASASMPPEEADFGTSVRAIQNLLSNLSHELRTPLNGILGFTHLLESSSLSTNQKVWVDHLLASGQRLLVTVDNLLDLAQFETGAAQVENHAYSPTSVFETVVNQYRPQAQAKGLAFSYQVEAETPVVSRGDPVRLAQAWGHVLSNAIKFTEVGSVSVTLQAPKDPITGDWLEFTVVDSGIGFPEGASLESFTPFQQVDGSWTRKFGGNGLGLALCDRISRALGGSLGITRRPEGGTLVRVLVAHSQGPQVRGNHPPRQILVQENDPATRLALTRMLETEGHRVDVVSDAWTDLPAALATYDLVLFAGQSPGLVPGQGPALVFLTEKAGSSGALTPGVATLVKPVTFPALRAILADIEKRRAP